MKKLIFLLLLLPGSVSSFCQQTNSILVLTKQDYLQKSKKQKTAAQILLYGGVGLIVAGGVIGISQAFDNLFEKSPGLNTGALIFCAGNASMLSSIPLFISSKRNKKRSIGLSFKSEPATQFLKPSFVNRSVSSLTFKISL